MIAALRDRPIRWMAGLYASASIFDWALSVALMVYVYGRTGSPVAAGTMLVCSQVVPGAALYFLGDRSDRWTARRALAFAFASQGLFVIVLAVFGPPIYLAAIAIGFCGAVLRAQLRAGLAQSAAPDAFRAASALFNLIRGATTLVAPGLTALAVYAFDARSVLIGIGSMLVIAGLAAFGAPVGSQASQDLAQDDLEAPILPAPGGISARALIAVAGVIVLALSVDEPILLAYVHRNLGGDVGQYGLLLSTWGVGTLVGTALFSRVIGRSMVRVFALATGVGAIAHLGLAVAPSVPFALVACLLGGLANGVDWAALTTAIMERAPRGEQASISGRLEAVATVAAGTGFLLGGVLAASTSPRIAFLVPAAAPLLVMLVIGIQALAGRMRLPAIPKPSPRPTQVTRGI